MLWIALIVLLIGVLATLVWLGKLLMPGKQLIKFLFYASLVICLSSFIAITASDFSKPCFRSECFDNFLNKYKFPFWMLGGLLALWTLELTTRRSEQMHKSYVLDKHYRRMEYFSKTLDSQLRLLNLENTIELNYSKFYLWLYPNSTFGDYTLSNDFLKLIETSTELSQRAANFIDKYICSSWFPYMGNIPALYEDLDISPKGSGIGSIGLHRPHRMTCFNDSILNLVKNKAFTILSLIDAVIEVDDTSQPMKFPNSIKALKEATDTLNKKYAKIDKLQGKLLQYRDLLVRRVDESISTYSDTKAGSRAIAELFIEARKKRPLDLYLEDYMICYILEELKNSFHNRPVDLEKVAENISDKTHDKYLIVKAGSIDKEFENWTNSLELSA